MTFNEMMSLFVGLIAMLNPLGSVAIFTSLVPDRKLSEQRQIIIHCTIAIIVIMCVVVWAGLPLLSFLGISLSSFKLAGGLIVVLSGLQMIQAKNVDRKSLSEQGMIEKESPAVVPLATPLIAGPGAISTIMAHLGEGHAVQSRIEGTIICVIVGLIVGLFLWFSPAISKWIGRNGLRVTSQLMGLILMSIAFQMITSGLADVFPAIAK